MKFLAIAVLLGLLPISSPQQEFDPSDIPTEDEKDLFYEIAN